MSTATPVPSRDHWIKKGDINLFMFEKPSVAPGPSKGTILFVHGSSMASQPTFDLQVPGRDDSSAMDVFARLGYDTWTVDMEGYGRSDKHRDINFDIANGGDDLVAASAYIMSWNGNQPMFAYGISSGALRAATLAVRHPERIRRLALDAFVWTGEGSHTLHERKKKLPQFLAANRRPIDRAFVYSIFERDHPETTSKDVIEAFADAILSLDDSMPTGTYVDMCSKLPVIDPLQLTVPTLIMRGEFDGIASMEDLIAFFVKLPNMDKQFTVMPGISHASFQQKNYALCHSILNAFFERPDPVYLAGH